jgi:hypothetical protein
MAGGAWIWNTRQYHGYEKKSGDVNAQLKLTPSANIQPNHGLPLAFRADGGASRELVMHRGRDGPARHYLIVFVCVPAPSTRGAVLCCGRYLGNTNARSGAEGNTRRWPAYGLVAHLNGISSVDGNSLRVR